MKKQGLPQMENMLPDLDFPFVEEMRTFSRPCFPGKESGGPAPAGKWRLLAGFPDEKKVLDTAYESCRRGLKAGGADEADAGGYLLKTEKKSTETFEEYSLAFTKDSCTVSANDPEGIRRGLYAFLDEFCAHGGAFPEETRTVTKKPFLSVRLGRCPFSPIKRWPVNTDELLDDVDYYPDAYLETLAHDGINGIWLVTQLRELGKSSFTKEDPQRMRRLAKLKRVAEKCGRYGIKVWLFMIEPFAVPDDDELFREHPELFMKKGKSEESRNCFCPAADSTLKYLREITESIFSEVPLLGGVVDIVYGERPTTCPSVVRSFDESPIPCQDRCGLSKNEIMRRALQAISDGIRAGSREAKLIAWYYMPHPPPLASWCRDLARYTPPEVIAQFNFESGGEKTQLGKVHCAGDYWVSYEGPAERFREAAIRRGENPMGAKLQLGCGHELTPVPYIPVPEIAYEKYKAMYELKVNCVMQSWYIGNFPGLMERACGRLAFEDFKGGREAFLRSLAAPVWGSDAETVTAAWKIFADAYRKFPFSLMFQYYAPQNAFMMWEYHFLPDLEPLAPPWKPNFAFGGDAVGEALAGFTLEDAALLMREMSEEWKTGVEQLRPLREKYGKSLAHMRDLGIAELLGYLMEGTSLLLDFFLLRRRLYTEKLSRADAVGLIEEMKGLLDRHRELCQKCIPLLEADSRLGYHGEALCRIFDEKKTFDALKKADGSASAAEKLLEAVKNGLSPLEYAEKTVLDVLPENTVRKAGKYPWFWKKEKEAFVLTFSGLPPGSDVTGKAFFMDLTGTRFALQDVFHVKKGKCIRTGNLSLVITGKEFDSGFTMDLAGDRLTLRWPLRSLPGAVEEGLIRFTFVLKTAEGSFFAKGKGGTERLYLYELKPNETFTLDLR